jgi:putative transposase
MLILVSIYTYGHMNPTRMEDMDEDQRDEWLAYAQSYNYAFKKVLAGRTTPTTTPVHIREITLKGTVHNNKMERMNGEVRDRERVMRGLKNMDTPILKGMQIYHNFIRPHESLNGETPADRAGIKVEGTDKWRTLIQNAKHEKEKNELQG